MPLEKEEDRKKRFKAMLQYLILREACEFEGNNPVSDKVEEEAQYASESAKKILKEMELKFYDLFVKDDLVEDYLFFDAPYKKDAINQKDRFKNLIQQKISDKITVINSIDQADTADTASQHNKKLLEKIVRSPIIENSIMTCCLSTESKESYLISNIDEVFQSRNLANINSKSLVQIRDEFLYERENECCKISENSIAIQAHLKTATALSLGFLNLTGKIITKALGDLSGGLFQIDKDSASPSKSVRGERIIKILNSLNPTQDYI